jgi:hypothetical protein
MIIKIYSTSMHSLFPYSGGIHCIVLVAILGFWHSSGFGELLQINAVRWVSNKFDLTKAGGNPANGYLGIRYGQSIILYFSGANDASTAEISLADNFPYPLEKTTLGAANDHGFFFNNPDDSFLNNAVLVFSLGGEFSSWQELNEMVPANHTYTIRFSGGDLGPQVGTIFLQDDFAYFSSPTWATASDSSLETLARGDSSADMNLGINEPGEWQITILDSGYRGIVLSPPLHTNELVLPANTFQPGLTYSAMFYRNGPMLDSWSFGNYTRQSSINSIPLVHSAMGVQETIWFQTIAPRLKFRARDSATWTGQATRLDVEVESNPGYTGVLEFTESLNSAPVWTSVTRPISFDANGIGNLTLEKTGDFRDQWDQRLFFRVRNSRPPVEAPDFMPIP